ncbi:MAG: molybdopterin-dependent oxidoreductase [Chloroflexi bacterium]|nr:molybdopterin-dependent oxidoreductase [Chloroflexota bacterium]
MTQFSVVGKRIPRLDGPLLVTGEARYAGDVKLRGMLHGKILRSPHPHARILRIDTHLAEALPGVKAIVTAQDTPKIKYTFMGPAYTEDKYPLAVDEVCYIGDEVAAVAAVDEDTAREALELIQVDYEILPAIFDPIAASQPGAPLVSASGGGRNIIGHSRRHYGDVERAFAEADYIVEDTFTTHPVAHSCMEPHSCLAHFELNGDLTLWSSTQAPYYARQDLARVLPMPFHKIRFHHVHVGGGFGSKSRITEEAIAAFLSRKSHRPVRVVLSREEEFISTRSRHPHIIWVKVGARRDGTLLAWQARIIIDNGAYSDVGPLLPDVEGRVMCSLYRVPNIQYEGYAVYTNNPWGGRFRAFGSTQIIFAMESLLDMLAERMGMDPLELRAKNANLPNTRSPWGNKITSCGQRECLEQAAEAIGWPERRKSSSPGQGVGLASFIHVSGVASGEFSSAYVNISEDAVTVLTGNPDIGQGSSTILAQIAAEELGVPVDKVRVIAMDTATTPLDLGSRANRVTFTAGNAVRAAAAEAKKELLALAAQKLEASPDDLEIRDGQIFVAGSQDKAIPFSQVSGTPDRKGGVAILGKGQFDHPAERGIDAYAFGAQAAEVAVDPETGEVTVLQVAAAHDLGRAINPMNAEGQLEGGIAMALGYTLRENLVRVEGQTLNPNFADYKLSTALDVPPLRPILVESVDPNGPFGAKGVGEPAGLPTAPALANAIYHATGIRIKDLPITPERLLRALKEKGKQQAPP